MSEEDGESNSDGSIFLESTVFITDSEDDEEEDESEEKFHSKSLHCG